MCFCLCRLLVSSKFLPRVAGTSTATQDKIDVKISAYREQAARLLGEGSARIRQTGRNRRIIRSDDGALQLRRSDSDPSSQRRPQ